MDIVVNVTVTIKDVQYTKTMDEFKVIYEDIKYMFSDSILGGDSLLASLGIVTNTPSFKILLKLGEDEYVEVTNNEIRTLHGALKKLFPNPVDSTPIPRDFDPFNPHNPYKQSEPWQWDRDNTIYCKELDVKTYFSN